MIARFMFLGVCFFAPRDFRKKCNPPTRKHRFSRSGGFQKWSQHDPKIASKIKLLRGRPLGGPPGAILEAPRGSPEAPESAPGAPGEPQERPGRPKVSPRRPKMSPRKVQMSPRRTKMSPRRAKVSIGRSREASGSDFGMIFRSIYKQRDATETLPTQITGEGA